jgi:lysophospholipase
MFQQDLRGEISVVEQEFFSHYSNTHINSILRILGLENIFKDKQYEQNLIIPLIIIKKIESHDLETLKDMKNEIINFPFKILSKKLPLHLACKLGDLEIVKFILSCKLDINTLNYKEYTPLDYSVEFRNSDVSLFIKNQGGILNKNKNNYQLNTKFAYENDLKSLKVLYECGANLLACDYDGRNCAHIAAKENYIEIIKFLIDETDLDIMINDRWGNTPYSEGDEEIKKIILKKYDLGKYYFYLLF